MTWNCFLKGSFGSFPWTCEDIVRQEHVKKAGEDNDTIDLIPQVKAASGCEKSGSSEAYIVILLYLQVKLSPSH